MFIKRLCGRILGKSGHVLFLIQKTVAENYNKYYSVNISIIILLI